MSEPRTAESIEALKLEVTGDVRLTDERGHETIERGSWVLEARIEAINAALDRLAEADQSVSDLTDRLAALKRTYELKSNDFADECVRAYQAESALASSVGRHADQARSLLTEIDALKAQTWQGMETAPKNKMELALIVETVQTTCAVNLARPDYPSAHEAFRAIQGIVGAAPPSDRTDAT